MPNPPSVLRSCLVALIAALVLLGVASAKPTDPHAIKTGVFITSISDLEPADGSFRLTGSFWFIDPEARFDPLKHAQILARTIDTTVVETRLLAGGASYSLVHFDAIIDSVFDVSDYPFDNQSLQMVITLRQDVTQAVFKTDDANSGIADVVSVPGWVVGDLRLRTSYKTYESGFGFLVGSPAFSRITLQIDADRKRSPLMFEKFSGFLVSLVITALAFAVPARELGTRLGMLTSAIFAAVLNLNRLEDSIGFDVSLGLVDQVSLITFGAILFSLAYSIYAHRLSGRKGPAVAAIQNRWVCLGFLVFFSALLTAAFWLALN